jgi:hypothetical protein
VMLMALYLHLGPFSKHVISEVDRRIAELDGMHSGRATGSSARADHYQTPYRVTQGAV